MEEDAAMDKRRILSTVCIICGAVFLLLGTAVWLFVKNQSDKAGENAAVAVIQLHDLSEKEVVPAETPVSPAPNASAPPVEEQVAQEEAETREVYQEYTAIFDGRAYLGLLYFPGYDLELPVLAEWDFPGLDLGPERYAGSIGSGSLVIGAHNYASHFSLLNNMEVGDQVVFTDVLGNEFRYVVRQTDVLKPSEQDLLLAEGWDLTLFTCTFGGQARQTLRCELVQ